MSPVLGFPALTVPAGFTADGLPVGLEFLGRAFTEEMLLRFGFAYEQATRHRRPPGTAPPFTMLGLSANTPRLLNARGDSAGCPKRNTRFASVIVSGGRCGCHSISPGAPYDTNANVRSAVSPGSGPIR